MKKELFFKRILAILFCALLVFALFLPAYAAPGEQDEEIITEGVETKEQADFLLGEGSAEMQGYYFYRPMPVEDFEKLEDFING